MWMGLAILARATDRAPKVAKYCLNLAILTRIQSKKTGRGAASFFTGPDFIEAKEMATTIDWATRSWDKECYEQVSEHSLKMYRGLILPKTKYPGKEDRQRTRQIGPPETRDATVAAASAGGPSVTQSLTAILDASSSPALPPTLSVSSSSDFSSLAEGGRSSSERHTPLREIAPALCPAPILAPAPAPSAPAPAASHSCGVAYLRRNQRQTTKRRTAPHHWQPLCPGHGERSRPNSGPSLELRILN